MPSHFFVKQKKWMAFYKNFIWVYSNINGIGKFCTFKTNLCVCVCVCFFSANSLKMAKLYTRFYLTFKVGKKIEFSKLCYTIKSTCHSNFPYAYNFYPEKRSHYGVLGKYCWPHRFLRTQLFASFAFGLYILRVHASALELYIYWRVALSLFLSLFHHYKHINCCTRAEAAMCLQALFVHIAESHRYTWRVLDVQIMYPRSKAKVGELWRKGGGVWGCQRSLEHWLGLIFMLFCTCGPIIFMSFTLVAIWDVSAVSTR